MKMQTSKKLCSFLKYYHMDILHVLICGIFCLLLNDFSYAWGEKFVYLQYEEQGQVQGSPSTDSNALSKNYGTGLLDYCTIVFYALICTIIHGYLNYFIIDNIVRNASKCQIKAVIFRRCSHLFLFDTISSIWAAFLLYNAGHLTDFRVLWKEYPNQPMNGSVKFYYLVQLAYYAHMLPQIWLQKEHLTAVQRRSHLLHAFGGLFLMGLTYFGGFHSFGLVHLPLHYCSEGIANIVQMINLMDGIDACDYMVQFINFISFFLTRFTTMVICGAAVFFNLKFNAVGMRWYFTNTMFISVFLLQCYFMWIFGYYVRELCDKDEILYSNVLQSAERENLREKRKQKKKRKQRKKENDKNK